MRYLFFLIIILPSIAFGQKLNSAYTNIQNFSDSVYFYKIFVHTDKEKYYSGENIWFKAYLFDFSKKSENNKQLLYVQLIDFEHKTIIHKNYYIINNLSDGKILLPDTIPEGAYQLRFFCNPQRNFSSEFYFTKEIYVFSDRKIYSSDFYKEAKKIKRKRKKIHIQYNIEGKQIVYGLPCKIFYRITNNREKSLNVNIILIDNKNNIVFEKNDTQSGIIEFTPEQDKKYYLIAEKNKYKKCKTQINEIKLTGITAQKTDFEKNILLKFMSNKIISTDTVSSTYLLLGINNSKIIYVKYFKLDSIKEISVKKSQIPVGVSFFYLINKYSEIENILPFFKPDTTSLGLNLTYKYIDDTLILNIFSKTLWKKNLSISITNDTQYFYNINEYINLYFNMPEFKNYKEKEMLANEILCGLYARQCFDIAKIIKNKNHKFPYKPDSALSIKGKVSFVLDKAPARFAKIKLRILNSFNDEYSTISDEYGNFAFYGLTYSDSIEFLLKGVNRFNKKYILFFLNESDSEQIHFNPFIYNTMQAIRYKYVRPSETKPTPYTSGTLHSHADQIIYSDEIEQSGQNNILEFLQGRVPGYQKVGNSAIIRGYSSITLSNEPLFLIDNIQVDANAAANLDMNNIERIEILRSSANTAIYGQRGGNGVIAIYTKQGHIINWGKLHGKMAGISYPETFFITDTAIYRHKTFYWNPEVNFSDKITLKIPLSKKGKYFVYINGVENEKHTVHLFKELDISN